LQKKIYLSKSNNGGASFYKDKLLKEEKISPKRFRIVKCISLKELFIKKKLNNINLLKLDCEGAEYDILFNTPERYLNKIEKIILEFHDFDGKSSNKLKNFLKNQGFILKKIRQEKRDDLLYGTAYYCKPFS